MRTQLLSVLVSVIVVCRPPPSVIIAVRSPSWPTRMMSRHPFEQTRYKFLSSRSHLDLGGMP